MRFATHVLSAALLVLTLAAPPSHAEETIRVGAYNLENAFDVFDDPYTEDEATDVKSRSELKQIAAALRALDADVVGISEIEHQEVLKAMIAEFIPDMGYKYVGLTRSNSGRGINIGVISRKPIVSLTSHRWQELTLPGESRTWRFARDLVLAKIQATENTTLDVYVVHLKSRRSVPGDTNAIKWRSSEATRLREIIDARLDHNPNLRALVVGDFNANPDQPAMQLLVKPQADGTQPLTDLHDGMTTEQRITYPSKRYPNTIFDYILATPAMVKAHVPGSQQVFGEEGKIGGSDHLPVAADFKLP